MNTKTIRYIISKMNLILIAYFSRFLKWIWEGRLIYLLLILISLIFLVKKIDIGLNPVDNIKIYGLLLQLSGTIIIIHSLKDKLILFRGHGLRKFIIDYLRSFPRKKHIMNFVLTSETNKYSLEGCDIKLLVGPKENINEIIRYFDEEIKYLHQRLNKTNDELKKKFKTINEDNIRISSSFGNQIKQTKKLISDSTISNIWLDLFGVLVIFIGLIFGTIPDIIEKII